LLFTYRCFSCDLQSRNCEHFPSNFHVFPWARCTVLHVFSTSFVGYGRVCRCLCIPKPLLDKCIRVRSGGNQQHPMLAVGAVVSRHHHLQFEGINHYADVPCRTKAVSDNLVTHYRHKSSSFPCVFSWHGNRQHLIRNSNGVLVFESPPSDALHLTAWCVFALCTHGHVDSCH
jgi:hypothetical protein